MAGNVSLGPKWVAGGRLISDIVYMFGHSWASSGLAASGGLPDLMSRKTDGDCWWDGCIGHMTSIMWLARRTAASMMAAIIKSQNPLSSIVFGKDCGNRGKVE